MVCGLDEILQGAFIFDTDFNSLSIDLENHWCVMQDYSWNLNETHFQGKYGSLWHVQGR